MGIPYFYLMKVNEGYPLRELWKPYFQLNEAQKWVSSQGNSWALFLVKLRSEEGIHSEKHVSLVLVKWLDRV